jgi:glutamate carboxypeptidase
MDANETLSWFEARKDAAVAAIRELVDIESPSHDVERSRRVAAWVEDQAAAIGPDLQVEKTFAEGYGEHLVIRAFPSGEKPVLLLGHTDTVHPAGTCALNKTRIADDKLFGCGVFDMKSGVVVMLETLRYFGETGTRTARPVNILLSCDEEVGSFTGRALVEREASKAAYCLVCEPSSHGRVKTGRKGTGMFTLKTWGKPAHAGLEPEKGASAILEIARQIERLQALDAPDVGTTVNVCTIRGGTTTNVIPEHAECTIDVRFTSASEAERIAASIKELEPVDPRVKLLVTGGINRPPLERNDAVAGLYEKARDVAASFGYDLGETQVGGASDGNFVAALGVPVLDGLGVAGDGAHTLEEYIYIDDIPKRAALLALMLTSV